jgi:hypothetical protein
MSTSRPTRQIVLSGQKWLLRVVPSRLARCNAVYCVECLRPLASSRDARCNRVELDQFAVAQLVQMLRKVAGVGR